MSVDSALVPLTAGVERSQHKSCFTAAGLARTAYAAIMFCGLTVVLKCIGTAMPNYQYQFILGLAVGSTAFFALIWGSTLARRRCRGEALFTELDIHGVWRQALANSTLLAANYILVGVSNPFVEGPLEVRARMRERLRRPRRASRASPVALTMPVLRPRARRCCCRKCPCSWAWLPTWCCCGGRTIGWRGWGLFSSSPPQSFA